MIKVIQAIETNAKLLAELANTTYVESHAHFINDRNDLQEYVSKAFSVSTTSLELSDKNNLFYIAYLNDIPIGYVKLMLNVGSDKLTTANNICLERIYVLNEYIPLKVGQKLLDFVVNTSQLLNMDTLWLTVYVKNERAIRFYRKNDFKVVGETSFLVNNKAFDNLVFSKTLRANCK